MEKFEYKLCIDIVQVGMAFESAMILTKLIVKHQPERSESQEFDSDFSRSVDKVWSLKEFEFQFNNNICVSCNDVFSSALLASIISRQIKEDAAEMMSKEDFAKLDTIFALFRRRRSQQ